VIMKVLGSSGAELPGHLTLRLLKGEPDKMRFLPKKDFIAHPKPQYLDQIRREIREAGSRAKVDMRIVKEGDIYQV